MSFHTIARLQQQGIFEHNGHKWRICEDDIGYCLYRDGELFRTYAWRVGFANDILADIGMLG